MKGTILDFLKLTAENPELVKELVELAAKYDFQFSDEVSDQELDSVAGGAVTVFANARDIATKGSTGTSSVSPDVCKTPSPGDPVPIPYPSVDSTDGTATKDGATKG